MLVNKCDLCKKQIKGEPVVAGFGYWRRTELCRKCGKPIIEFLEKSNVENKNKKNSKAS